MVTWYWSADNLIWQVSKVSIEHSMMSYIKKYTVIKGCMSLSTYYLEDGSHLARLHRRRRRCRAYALTSNTASPDNHEKISSWTSFSFLYGYGAPPGGPPDCRSSAIIWSMAAILRDSTVAVAAVRTRPRAIPLATITMSKLTPFLSYMSMGLRRSSAVICTKWSNFIDCYA